MGVACQFPVAQPWTTPTPITTVPQVVVRRAHEVVSKIEELGDLRILIYCLKIQNRPDCSFEALSLGSIEGQERFERLTGIVECARREMLVTCDTFGEALKGVLRCKRKIF